MSAGRIVRSGLAFGALLIALGACADRSPPEVPLLEGVVALEIGAPASGTSFGGMGGLAADDAGRIYVADLIEEVIRVFEPDGSPAFTIGSPGDGPGQFRSPCCIAFGPAGRLWVRETLNGRYTSYEVGENEATPGGVLRAAHEDIHLVPLRFGEDFLVDVGHAFDPEAGETRLFRFYTPFLGGVASTDLIDLPEAAERGGATIELESSDGVEAGFFFAPYGPVPLDAHGPGQMWAQAMSDADEIVLHPTNSLTVRIEGFWDRGPLLSNRERARGEELVALDKERAGPHADQIRYGVPARRTPLESLFFDQRGRLWVEVAVADGQPRQAFVYDATGTAVAERRWPFQVRLDGLGWVGDDWALGIVTGEDGASHIARVEWTP